MVGTQLLVQKRKPGGRSRMVINGDQLVSATATSFPLLRFTCFAVKVVCTDMIKKSWMRPPALETYHPPCHTKQHDSDQ